MARCRGRKGESPNDRKHRCLSEIGGDRRDLVCLSVLNAEPDGFCRKGETASMRWVRKGCREGRETGPLRDPDFQVGQVHWRRFLSRKGLEGVLS